MIIEIPDTLQTVVIGSIGVGECFIYGNPEREDVYPLFMRCRPPLYKAAADSYWAVNLESGDTVQLEPRAAVAPKSVKVVPV